MPDNDFRLPACLRAAVAFISAGDLDAFADHIRDANHAHIIWQNVDNCPEWVAGAKPTRFVGQRWLGFNLASRQSVTIAYPHAVWSSASAQGTIANGDLQVTRSTGTHQPLV